MTWNQREKVGPLIKPLAGVEGENEHRQSPNGKQGSKPVCGPLIKGSLETTRLATGFFLFWERILLLGKIKKPAE